MEMYSEINALLTLIDDPDEEVFSTVEKRLITLGLPIIPNLEDLLEQTLSQPVQGRIESIIHQLHYTHLTQEFTNWKNGDAELLHGALLVAKYQFPEMNTAIALQELEKMRRNIWLELNNYLTPLEQIKVMESILYHYYKLEGGEIAYKRLHEFAFNKVLETKKGNAITTGILYLVLGHLLDLPIVAIQIPHQFMLAYLHPESTNIWNEEKQQINKIKLYIDPSTGAAHSHADIEIYLKKIKAKPVAAYFKPKNSFQIITQLLKELAHCFDSVAQAHKKRELDFLVALLENHPPKKEMK